MPDYLDTGGDGCSPQSYFFEQTQTVITIDDENSRIGINNTNPQYDLDVNGTITTSHLIADGLIQSSNILNTGTVETTTLNTSNLTANGLVQSSNILNTGEIETATSTITQLTTSNITSSNVTARQFLQGLTINAESNLCWGGHSLQQPYPGDPSDWDDLIPFSGDTEGLIHQSWIYKPLSGKDVLTDLFNAAELGVDIAQTLADAYQFFQGTTTEALTQAAVDALTDALDNLGDETSSNPKIIVSWSNLKNKPIANNNNTIGINGDMYVNPANSLKVLDGGSFTTDQWNNTKFSASPSGTKVIDFNTKEAFLSHVTLSNNDRATIYQPDEIVVDDDFKVGTLRMGFENASNTQLFNSQSNITINDIVLKKNDYGITTLVSENVDASSFRDSTNFNSALNFLSFESGWTFCDRYATGSYSTNANDWEHTFLYLKPKKLEFKTQEAAVGGVPQHLVTQFSVNSNGTLFCRSNIQMNSPAIIRSVQTSLDDVPREGILTIEPTVMRFKESNSTELKTNWSVNSNGMFLLQKNSIYGNTELAHMNFVRLDQTLEDGFVWGKGMSNDFATNRNIFKFSRNGELFTTDVAGNMRMSINSNAELHKGTMVIDNTGNLKVNGSNVILSSGTIQRRTNPDSNAGFQVSPSGFLTMGNLSINPEGVLTSTAQATFSNLTASNINAVSITSVNITESNLFTSNVSAMALLASNITADTAFVRSNLDVGALTLSNNQVFFKTGTTSNMIISANTINNINNGTFVVSHPATGNTLSTFSDGRTHLLNNRGATLTQTSLNEDYPLLIRHISAANDTRSGIAFGATNQQGLTPGAAITFTRTGGNSQGELNLHTKATTGGQDPCSVRMTIKNDGRVGIGTTSPAQLLDVNGTIRGTTLQEGTSNLIDRYALSNALSNVNSNLITLSNAYSNFTLGTYPTFSNATWCNLSSLSNSLSNCCFTNSSNFTTFSNWSSSNFVGLSNSFSNFTLTTYPAFSNATWSNMTTINTNITGVSNWTNANFRKTSVNVPWSDISGKPNFSTSNDSIDFAGVALGSAGLLFGGLALLNQNGQLTSALQNVAGSLKLNTSGYSRMDEGLKLLGDGANGITLDPSGAINAITGNFTYSKFTGGVDIGTATMSLSNDQIYWKNGATSNMILGSNSLVVRNNQPFTISNANVITNCNVSAPSFTESGTALSNRYALSNSLSNVNSNLITFSNWISPLRTTTTGGGITIQGNFGQWQLYTTYTDFNTNPAHWGWNFVQGSNNAPNTTSAQWYREVVSLGSEYPMRGTLGFSLELAVPRYNHATAGCHIRTIENGVIGGWTEIGIRPTNTLSNNIYPISTWASNTSMWSSNNSSNLTPLTTYNTFSNWVSPMSVFGSNAHSNYTPLSNYNTFSNWISPTSVWASNALSNYTPIASDKFWTFSNSRVHTLSNVSIGRTSNFPANITLDVFNSNNSGFTAWFQDGASNQLLMTGANLYHYTSNLGAVGQLHLGDLENSQGYSNTAYNINFQLNPAAVPTAQIQAVSDSNYSANIVFTTRRRTTQVGSNINDERMRITSVGNVGIGTSTPTSQLHTTGNAILNNATVGNIGWGSAYAGFAHSNCANQTQYAILAASDGGTIVNCGAGRSIELRVNNTTRLFMNSNGDVRVRAGVVNTIDPSTGSGYAWKASITTASNFGFFFSSNADYLNIGPDGSSNMFQVDTQKNTYTYGNSLIQGNGNYLELGNGQSKGIDDGKIRYKGWNDYVNIVGTNNTTVGTRYVKIWDYLFVDGTGYSSDSNLKENIQPLGRMLDKMDKVEGKTFEWKDDLTGKNKRRKGKQVGLLAQDIQQVCPEAVQESDDGLTYDQTALNGVLIQLIRDLKNEIDDLKKNKK